MELWELDATGLAEVYRRRKASPREAFDSLRGRIEEVDPMVGAFTTLTLERAADEADARSSELAKGSAIGALHGIPVAIKELFDVEGAETTYGSLIFSGHVPYRDAEAVRRLRHAGAIVLGLTRCHEFAWGITTQHQRRGSTYNPWDLGRVPGGSSGGSAAAVATGMVPLALGSDSGGSIRIPASYCGVAGIKPTYGRISKRGACRLIPSYDHVGPIARSVRDLATAMSALAGYDAEDPSTLTEPFDEPMIERGIEGLRIGIAPDLHLTPLAPDHEKIFSHVVDTATSIAGTAREVHIPHADVIRPAFTIIQLSESHHVHASELGIYPSRASEYGPDVIERLEMARRVTLSEYLSAVEQVRWIRRRFQIALQEVDVILTPVYAGGPSRVVDPGFSIHRGERIPFREVVMNYTVPQNLTGLPAASIRAGFDDDGIPVGVQATASWGNEEVALRVAAALQVALGEDAGTWPRLLPKEA